MNMFLSYPNKKSISKILQIPKTELSLIEGKAEFENKLIFGDNLGILQALIQDFKLKGKIDLIYIDPPFATNNKFYISEQGRANTISSSTENNIAYTDELIGFEFLEFMRERLILLRELLSEQGSIYVHTDYKIGHYLKIIMDEIFGIQNFRNDITRIKCNPKNFARRGYGNIKDLILFYSKTSEPIWNEIKVAFNEEEEERLFSKVDQNGRKYTTVPIHAPGETKNGKTGQEWRGIKPPEGRHWRCEPDKLEELDNQGLLEWSKNGIPRRKIFADEKEGKKLQDIWEFKDPQYPVYPTEKNAELLQTIIKTSSNENSIILDCFCGSGTTIREAQKLSRSWIGTDKSEQAIKVCRNKIEMANRQMDLFYEPLKYSFYADSQLFVITHNESFASQVNTIINV